MRARWRQWFQRLEGRWRAWRSTVLIVPRVLKAIRTRLRLSQTECAAALGVSVCDISRDVVSANVRARPTASHRGMPCDRAGELRVDIGGPAAPARPEPSATRRESWGRRAKRSSPAGRAISGHNFDERGRASTMPGAHGAMARPVRMYQVKYFARFLAHSGEW